MCEAPDVYTVNIRTARKPYRCCECFGPIVAGEKYENFRGLWDGYWATYRTCLACLPHREEMAKQIYPDLLAFGELWSEASDEDVPDYVLKLRERSRQARKEKSNGTLQPSQ